MLKPIFIAMLSFILPFGNISSNLFSESSIIKPRGDSGILEKMIVANGDVVLNINLDKLNGNQSSAKESNLSELQFDINRDSFFNILVFDKELRSTMPGSMRIVPKNELSLPKKLNDSINNLLIEKMPFGEDFGLVIRDRKTGFKFFNIVGQLFEYDSDQQNLKMRSGRILISKEFAQEIGRPSDAEIYVGDINIEAKMRSIEVMQIVNGEATSKSMPAMTDENAGTRPGPDVVVGNVFGLQEFGSNGTQVGLAVGTDSCNFGNQNLNWFQLPNNDHPVIPQNLYRMSADTTRFEQIGQSSVKHAFLALAQNLCNLGCNGVSGTRLGSGCSDPYTAADNAGPNLGSRAWINPFTGVYPRGDSATNPNNHLGHSHDGTSHRILTNISDLNTQMNVGATYFAEGQYITPHEYNWCQTNPGQCNMNNNVSYRQFGVNGLSSPFAFNHIGETVREKAAVEVWTGATFVQLDPAPGVDGIGKLAYKVTETSPGVWHYEYAIYNQNMDRGIQSFSVPFGNGASFTNVDFHAPPQHPEWLNDGTLNNAGFSDAPWTNSQTSTNMIWNTETFAQNPNANAIRWGTMYNFRFDSNAPPQTATATIGFFKTGSPITVQIQGPGEATNTVASISGRVTSPTRGVHFARVSITDSGGNTRFTMTNPFGYYRFKDIPIGETYTISVFSKSYTFMPQTLQINKNLTNVNFEAEQ